MEEPLLELEVLWDTPVDRPTRRWFAETPPSNTATSR
jgi:hypothetical protein